ncbi:sulfite exporter TauE/SafE family protein [Alteromonas sediminis]|uniref:Probable membrane transporter protein n=1 Tax=Alteromonas sediminis TaxID=2259342 RepID=A0A3N5XWK9_9ALTE|nr:sulfite exporter TauE/SafE family protein [Alteromonas sediminis]RPJ65072.1 sulfite exporter TauE/SafE family protein [Alteromonas sediminis]
MPVWLKRFLVVFCLWSTLIAVWQTPIHWISDYFGYAFLGVLGAIFANSTGAGGGVVFVPFFNHLGFDETQIVATSFAIQCCGMTAGALTWFFHYKHNHKGEDEWAMFTPSIVWITPGAILGILLVQWGKFIHPTLSAISVNSSLLHLAFGVFSILLALAIFITIPRYSKATTSHCLATLDGPVLFVVSLIGGVVTAWLSVGVGELVAVYLIMRGFSVKAAIAVAVIISAFSVWSGVVYHLVVSEAIYAQVVTFAGLGAILGGLIAKYVVLVFSPVRLKIFFASWVMILGVSGLPVF